MPRLKQVNQTLRHRTRGNQSSMSLVSFNSKRCVQEELSWDNGAEETGQVCVGLHNSHGYQEVQAEARARPPCWKLRPGRSGPSRGPRVADHKFLIGDGKVLLDDGEQVQGKLAAQGDPEARPGARAGHKRDEGVRTQEQEVVAGVVTVVVRRRRGLEAKSPSTPTVSHACVCAAVACRDSAALPQRRQKITGSTAAARRVGREGAWAELEAPADSSGPGAGAGGLER